MQPSVGGTSLTHWQVDNRIYWDDGSLMYGVCRGLLPAGIAGSATAQIVWTVTTGTWPNTSSNTVADITGASDFKLAISNLHTAGVISYSAGGPSATVGLTMAGGAITGGVVHYNNTYSGTLNVVGGHGSGAQVTISGTTVTVNAGGSGYALEGTAGAFTASFNQGVTDAVYVKQYSKGPACDAWEVLCSFKDNTSSTAQPSLYGIFFVERWKNSGGTLLAFRASAKIINASFQTTTAMSWFTYDLDWKNGSTVIRGVSNSTTYYNAIQHWLNGSVNIVDPGLSNVDFTAKPDWSANDTAYKSIIPQLTPTECDQIAQCGILPRFRSDINPTVTVPTVQMFGAVAGSTDIGHIPYAAPMAYAGMRVPFGSGGSDPAEFLVTPSYCLHWMNLRHSNLSAARTWLAWMRGTASTFCTSAFGSAFIEPTTGYVPNYFPASDHVFTGMTPTRESVNAAPGSQGGAFQEYVGSYSCLQIGLTPYHLVFPLIYPYILEGDQWVLYSMKMSASNASSYWECDNIRQATVSGHTYYGLGWYNDNRLQAWWHWAVASVGKLLPTTWADGTTNIEQSMFQYQANNFYAFINALVPFVGTWTAGTGATARAKANDWSSSGYWSVNADLAQQFMDHYWWEDLAASAAWFGSGASAIATFRDTFKKYMVGRWQGTGSNYTSFAYSQMAFVGAGWDTTTNVPDCSSELPVSRWNDTTPSTADAATQAQTTNGQPVAIKMTNGSANVTVCDANTNNSHDIIFEYPSTIIADGTKIKFTLSDTGGSESLAVGPYFNYLPSPFDFTTWYYLKRVSAGVYNLYSDASLTTLVTPTADLNNLFDTQLTGSIAGTTLTVTAITGGNVQTITADGTWLLRDNAGTVTSGTTINSQLTGTPGGTGTYVLSNSMTVASETMVAGRPGAQVQVWIVPANTLPANNSGAGTYLYGVQLGGETRLMEAWVALAASKNFGVDDTGENLSQALGNVNTMINSQPGWSDASILGADPFYALADGTIHT